MLQQTFPKGVALVENSPYNDIVRKKKKKKEKKDTKVKADSLQLKMKDIIKDAITAVGNPVSFETISQNYKSISQ